MYPHSATPAGIMNCLPINAAASGNAISAGNRHGIAQLEFIMVLVPVTFLFVGLLWTGSVAINFQTVSIEARQKAWVQRDIQRGDPFNMSDTAQGEITASARKKVNISPVVDSTLEPEAEHTVYGGAWHYQHLDPAQRHVDLDQVPNYQYYGKLTLAGASSKISSVVNFLRDFWQGIGFAEILKRIGLKTSVDEVIAQFRDQINTLINDLASIGNGSKNAAAKELNKDRDKVKDVIAKAKKALKADKLTVEQNKSAISKLADLIETEEDEDEPDEKKIKRLENRKKTLEDENRELEATDFDKRLEAIEEMQDGSDQLDNLAGKFND